MASSTVENYLKTIYLLQQDQPDGGLLPMGKLASAMQVVPGTATAMVKTLQKSNLVDYEPRDGVRLSDAGRELALHVLRRHRLVELLLVQLLGLDWSEVHEEAEQLEHVISDRVLERIDAVLGRPREDPHGDPIPTAHGQVPVFDLERLDTCRPALPYTVARIADQDPDFLRYAERTGLVPGAPVCVLSRNQFADALTVQVDDADPLTLGHTAAQKIMVRKRTA